VHEHAEDRAFLILSPSDVAEVASFRSERAVVAGELLFAAGDASYELFVVLDGEVEVVRSWTPSECSSWLKPADEAR
jgi:CRP-like cAMP-binding protein